MQTKIKAIANKIITQYNRTNLCASIECINQKINETGKKLANHGVSANFVTVISFVLGMVAVNFLALQNYFWALVFILLNRLGDALDGAIAKVKGKTDFGVFIDACLDYVFYAAVIFGFSLANPQQNALVASFLLFGFTASACAMLAYAVVAYSKGVEKDAVFEESPFYLGGMAQGFETVTAFVLLCLAPNWFVPVAIILGCWCLIKTLAVISSAYFKFVIEKKGK